MDVTAIRERIPALKKCIHLDCAAVSPFFAESVREMENFLENRGEKANFEYFEWINELEECRRTVAGFVNASPEEIAFMLNTSQGISTVAAMLNWKKGDNIVTSDLEFPSNSMPWYSLRKKGVEVRQVKAVDNEIRIEDIENAIDENTQLVAVSYVQFGNGFRINLEEVSELCREYNTFLFSDVIQGLGAVTLNVKSAGLDFFSSASYKWLMGPLGVSIFYIKKEHLSEFDPPWLGWFSLKEHEDFNQPGISEFELIESARKFEAGGKSFALIKGLKKSLEIFSDIGVDTIERRVLDLSSYVIENAERVQTPFDEKKRAGIVNVLHKDAENIAEALRKKKILVSARMGGIRVSTHFWNTKEDIDKLFEVIQ